MSGQLHAPAALPKGKRHALTTEQEAGWAPQRFWKSWRGGKPLAQLWIEPRFLSHPASSLVTIPTEPSPIMTCPTTSYGKADEHFCQFICVNVSVQGHE
jgi:hypothetical protein